MPEIRWIKLTTAMFDDEKIKLIEKLPDGDSLIVIWVKLICQAGKVNDGGFIHLKHDIPYTVEDLTTIFNRPLSVIKLALATFSRLQMIQLDDAGTIYITNWDKHQNTGALDKIREDGKLRQRKFREKAKQRLLTSGNVTVTLRNDTEEEVRSKKEEEEEDYNNPPVIPPAVTASAVVSENVYLKEFEYCFGRSPDSREMVMIRDFIQDANGTLTNQQVKDAFKEAAINNVLKFTYVKSILNKWTGR